MKSIVLIIVAFFITFEVYSQNELNQNNKSQVVVEINFGDDKSKQIFNVDWFEGITALTALQQCAVIETKPVNEYVFVKSIEGVSNIPQKNAWYYEVNRQKSKILAIRNQIKNGDTITWIYRKDICSKKK